MVLTRSSSRDLGVQAPDQAEKALAGTKRKADPVATPKSKRGKMAAPAQATIEQSLSRAEGGAKAATEPKGQDAESAVPTHADASNGAKGAHNGSEEAKDSAQPGDAGDSAIQQSDQREQKTPSNVLEKGIVYFLTRNRVGIDDAESVSDLQRTFFVLRPLPAGAKLGDGPLPDSDNNRVLALPKKVFPKSHSDRFMAFVEKAGVSIQNLKDSFLPASEHETKSAGTRRDEPVVTVAEGVYAITCSEDGTTHLAYMLTIPSELGEVQDDLGLRAQGSFVVSVKNPKRGGPARAQLPKAPEFPEEVIEEFRGLAWVAVKPNYLDYANAQILLIGEGTGGDMGKAAAPTTKDQKHAKETPAEQMEELEHEDELRVRHLHGDDSVFDDLQINKAEYPQVPTTW